jgi:HEAT repeat protein
LGWIGDERAIGPLLNLMGDTDDWVRQVVEAALDRLGHDLDGITVWNHAPQNPNL